jgi:mycothiol synthase
MEGRPISELVWRAGLDDAEIAEVRTLAAAATGADGVAPLSEHVLLHLGRDGAQAVHLLARDGAGLAAAAHLDLDEDGGGSAELVVHPDHRRAGLGAAMVRELHTRVPVADRLQLWAHGELPGAAVLAARLGLRRVRELRQLRLQLSQPPPAPLLPAGVRIRPFRVGADEAEFLRVNNAAFDWHPEQGGWGLDEVTQRERKPWFDPAGFLLAVDADDRLLGYHWTKVHPATGTAGPLGEVYVLGVDPAARGLHLGRALTLAGLGYLYDRGLRTVMLYVEADNTAAVRLYEALGFTRWHTDVSYAG